MSYDPTPEEVANLDSAIKDCMRSQVRRMAQCLCGLNVHEAEVVVREAEDIADALRRGVPTYGHWDPAKDDRNHAQEAEEEDCDRRVYTQMGRIVAEVRR